MEYEELDATFEGGDDYTPEPSVIEYEQPVDQANYAALIHDSFGERYVNVALLAERGGAVTILRVLGAMELEAREGTQFFLDGNQVSADHVLNAGQSVYIVGKLAGGK